MHGSWPRRATLRGMRAGRRRMASGRSVRAGTGAIRAMCRTSAIRLPASAGRKLGPSRSGCRGRRESVIACLANRSGSMLRGRVRRVRSTSARRSRRTRRITMASLPLARASEACIGRRPFLSGGFRRTGSACTTCTAMSGNGFRIAGTRTRRARRQMRVPGRLAAIALPASCGAARGSKIRGSCVLRTASGIRPGTGTSATGSVLPGNWIDS